MSDVPTKRIGTEYHRGRVWVQLSNSIPQSSMKGVILAAGRGTRLNPVTKLIPKPLLPIANRTTLEYAFDRLKEMDVHDICIVIGETEEQMRRALGDGASFDVNLTYVRQIEPHGLAHAVGFARDFVGDDSFVLYLGDAIYSGGFQKFAARFKESGCANLSVVKEMPDPTHFGVANVEGDRIVKLVEKPKVPESNLCMAGLYFFGPELWSVLPELKPSFRGEYEITDAIQILVDRGLPVLAGIFKDRWFDTGTLDFYLETSAFYLHGGVLVAPTATAVGDLSNNVAIGEGARLECGSIEDSVILPGAHVKVSGNIRHSIIGGPVSIDGDIENTILHGNYKG